MDDAAVRAFAVRNSDVPIGLVYAMLYVGDRIGELKPQPAAPVAVSSFHRGDRRNAAFLALLEHGFGQVDADRALDAIMPLFGEEVVLDGDTSD